MNLRPRQVETRLRPFGARPARDIESHCWIAAAASNYAAAQRAIVAASMAA
jgi:hypothetical protein